jgi:hypothetical protein
MPSNYVGALGISDQDDACLSTVDAGPDKTSLVVPRSRSMPRAIWRNSFVIAAENTLKRKEMCAPSPSTAESYGHPFRYDIWLGLRVALRDHGGSLSEERDKLQAERRSFIHCPKKVLDFCYNRNTMESEMEEVSAILDEYHYILDLYPSRRALEENLTGFSSSHFLARMAALQSWQNIWRNARLVYERLEYLKANSPFFDPDVALDSQPVEFFVHVIKDPLHRLRYTSFSKKDIQRILPKLFDEISLNDHAFQDMNLTEHVVDIRLVLLSNTAFEALSALAFTSHIYDLEKNYEIGVVSFAHEIVTKIDTALAMCRMTLAYIPADRRPPIFAQDIQSKIGGAVLKFVEFMRHRIATSKPLKLFRLMGFIEHLWLSMPEIGPYAPSLMYLILHEFW